MTTPADDRHLRLVTDDSDAADASSACVTCSEPAALLSAVNGGPLCGRCFRQAHWHPSWSADFICPAEEP